jgi:hypothetical protein
MRSEKCLSEKGNHTRRVNKTTLWRDSPNHLPSLSAEKLKKFSIFWEVTNVRLFSNEMCFVGNTVNFSNYQPKKRLKMMLFEHLKIMINAQQKKGNEQKARANKNSFRH